MHHFKNKHSLKRRNSLNKSKIALCILAVCSLFITGFSAQADTIATSGNLTTLHHLDIETYWPGYPIRTSEELIGSPDVRSMDVTWNHTTGLLQNIVIHLGTSQTIRFDSLFIDTGFNNKDTNWEDWDYFVNTKSSEPDNIDWGIAAEVNGDIPGQGLYAVNAGFSAPAGYTTVNSVRGRNGHPDGIDADFLTLLDTSVWGTYDDKKITYDFSRLGANSISVLYGFAIGYSPWCANDVILTLHEGADPVPEPATMLLFGTGLIGLAGFVRSRKMKK
jgi:hypothetical protein